MAEDNDSDEMYCEKHDLSEPAYESTDPHCPYCRQERRVEAERQEMMERRADPRMHPTVDAPRW